jgi:prepilin-type N-terminal cleavage/methylation domain-containing protein
MSYKKNRGITLIEIIVVVLIIALLAALGSPQFSAIRERALGKEAKANLKLIDAAEKIYRMETGFYYPSSGTKTDKDEINSNLKLSITETNWDYAITGASGGASYSATADRVDTAPSPYKNCIYSISSSTGEPSGNANCP